MTCVFCSSVGWYGGDVVLVGEPSQDLFAAYPVVGEIDRFRWLSVGLGRGELSEGTVRPGSVVMRQVFGQRLAQMMLIDDQQPVQELPAQGAEAPHGQSYGSQPASPLRRLFRPVSKPQMGNSATRSPQGEVAFGQVVRCPGTCPGPAGQFSRSPLEAHAGR